MIPVVACYLRLAVIHQRPGVTAPGLFYFVKQINIAETEKEKELKGEEKTEEKEIAEIQKKDNFNRPIVNHY